MDKKQEIEILQSLKGDTYFAQFFGGLDIDIMCQNIRNDFPIELNCGFYLKTGLLSKQLEEQKRKAREKKEEFIGFLIDDVNGEIPSQIYGRLVDAVGQLFIINWKRERQYPLTEAEIEWLVNEVNK